MDIEFPDLPDGFEFVYVAEVVYKGSLNRPISYINTTSVETKKGHIKNTGKIHQKIEDMKAVNELLFVDVEIAIKSSEDWQEECIYTIMKDYSESNVTNFAVDRRSSASGKESSSWLRGHLDAKYNVDRNFTWK